MGKIHRKEKYFLQNNNVLCLTKNASYFLGLSVRYAIGIFLRKFIKVTRRLFRYLCFTFFLLMDYLLDKQFIS